MTSWSRVISEIGRSPLHKTRSGVQGPPPGRQRFFLTPSILTSLLLISPKEDGRRVGAACLGVNLCSLFLLEAS